MSRTKRASMAAETVKIAEAGWYTAADGNRVEIAAALDHCLSGTRNIEGPVLAAWRTAISGEASPKLATSIEVYNEPVLDGIARLQSDAHGHPAVLNFASAKNPGGGFLNGSEAQEESLARSSLLYPSLLKGQPFYVHHRALATLLYTDEMIWSPHCPVIRDNAGALLNQPQMASFITSAAPNAGAIKDRRPEELPLLPAALWQRAEYVLTLAAHYGYCNLVLGAWGCGVFRNDPAMVAQAFKDHLSHPDWQGRFARVVFSVLDNSADGGTFKAFEAALN